jgi:redox-sensitive bicupin YhaK (pirin superfamily)
VDSTVVAAKAALVFADDGDAICIDNTGQDAVRGTLFIGKPLGQPIVAHGPFNGNTQEDINRYIRRYRAGGMGILEPGGKLLAKPDLSVD